MALALTDTGPERLPFGGKEIALTKHALERFRKRFGGPIPTDLPTTLKSFVLASEFGIDLGNCKAYLYYLDWKFTVIFKPRVVLVITCYNMSKGKARIRRRLSFSRAAEKNQWRRHVQLQLAGVVN
jgi:hypothetical protein